MSSLRALAAPALAGGAAPGAERFDGVLAVLDARRGEAFIAAYGPAEDRSGGPVSSPRALCRPGDLERRLSRKPRRGWPRRRRGSRSATAPSAFANSSPTAGRSWSRIPSAPPDHRRVRSAPWRQRSRPGRRASGVQPDYGRRPDAEIALEGARGERGSGQAAVACPPRPGARPVRGDGADRPTAVRRQIRPLLYPDLPEVMAIERRVYPTPWSLAMFVLELSKQSGICLPVSKGTRGRRTARWPAI